MADNFEKDWKEAFNKIEIAPSESVWEKVNSSLLDGELVYYKKKAAIYKWAAVVAVIFAISVSIPQFFDSQNGDERLPVVYQQDNPEDNLIKKESLALTSVSTSEPTKRVVSEFFGIDEKEASTSFEDYSGNRANENNVATSSEAFFIIQTEGKQKAPVLSEMVALVPEVTIYRKADYSVVWTDYREEPEDGKRFWAGLGVGSSSFDPNYQLNQPNDVVSAVMRAEPNYVSSVPESFEQVNTFNDRITSGVNYQLGVNLGVMLGKRFSLESGFQYAEAQLASHTDLIVENKIFAKSVAVTSEMVSAPQVSQVTTTQAIVEYERTDITLDNTFQFTSIPLKAGYQILDNRVQIKLNAGLITNIYMGNTLEDASDQVASLQLYPGANSPYRTISFSGITGLSLGYNLFNFLDLTLEPNFSQALQPLTKEESNFNATPNGFGMIAGVRYRFGN